MRDLLTKEQISKGLILAYLLCPDKKQSLAIVLTALLELEKQRVKEQRRFRNTFKLIQEKITTALNDDIQSPKIYLTDFQLYQWLILECANAEEIKQENTELVSQQLLTVRYLKYLVLKSVSKNVLFIITGFSRILHNYTTANTIDLCLSLYPNYKQIKNLDNQIKKTKAKLLSNLEERFDKYLKVINNRFQPITATNLRNVQSMTELINNTLEQLVLWDTDCSNSFSFHQINQHKLLSIGQQMSHIIIHPNCYNLLIKELDLEAPNNKLEIPKFFIANTINDDNDPFDPPDFKEDVPKLLKALEDYKKEVKNCTPSKLVIKVDEVKKGTLDLSQTNKFFLELDKEGFLEIFDHESNLRLLSRRLVADILIEKPEVKYYVIPIANGQRFTLIIKYIPPIFNDTEDIDEDTYRHTDDGNFEISISCHETSLSRALYWSYKRLLYELDLFPILVMSRFAVTSVILLILGLVAIYPNKIFNLDKQQTIVKSYPIPIIKQTPKSEPTPLEPEKQQGVEQLNTPKKNNKPTDLKPNHQIVPTPPEEISEPEPEQIATRGNNTKLAILKNIYISDLIESDFKDALVEMLKLNGFNVIQNPASNSIEGQLEYALPETNSIILSINNKVVFKKALDGSSSKQQAQSIVTSLVELIEKAKKELKQK